MGISKRIAEGRFGIDVFLLEAEASGDFLNSSPPGWPSPCFGLSGIERANCFCQAAGDQQGRRREYRAWLSITSVVDAICNIQGQIGQGCGVPADLGPFQMQHLGKTLVIAWDYGELSATGSRAALRNNAGLIWTGSDASGRASGDDCSGWTTSGGAMFGTAGSQEIPGTAFSDLGISMPCDSLGTLLCFERTR
ncbi:MAG: DUF1554 domain-containing protein [Turneriella sp.]|nr:DUF1554 domain-containing protein [Leptospiraceae bacterium]MCX7631924.1 DUF1554 domain-containing protein [Turneriella sp.]